MAIFRSVSSLPHCPSSGTGLTTGVQSRSRAALALPTGDNLDCDGKLWESRACVAGQCTSFTWNTSNWVEGRREVWCQRDDGLLIHQGEYFVLFKEIRIVSFFKIVLG